MEEDEAQSRLRVEKALSTVQVGTQEEPGGLLVLLLMVRHRAEVSGSER